MLSALSDFPVRPSRLAGESLSGYVHRFHWENGHEVPVTLRRALRQLFLGEHVATPYRPVAGGIQAVPSPDWEQLVLKAADTDPVQQRGTWRSRRYNPIRYCPDCLKNNGAHAVLWMLPLVDACPIHHRVLLSRCAVCGRSLGWGTLQPAWRCPCGARLSEAQSWPSPVWAARLADSIAKAVVVDLGESEGNARLLSAKSKGCALRDVYDVLEWAFSLRSQLAHRSPFTPGLRRFRLQKPITRKAPCAWEERVLSMEPDILEHALRRLVRWEFRGQQVVLVARRDDGSLAAVASALHRLPAAPFVEDLRRQAADVLEHLNAGIRSLSQVQFHPCIDNGSRHSYLVALADWWHCFATQTAVLRPNAEPGPSAEPRPSGTYFSSGSDPAAALQILNALLQASYRGEPVRRYWRLIAGWHLPEHLQRKLNPDEVLNELGNYLAGLTASELAFVQYLVDQA
jgi:hypothetical protein